MDRHTISGGGLTATVLADGAELCSLKDPTGRELMWQAGPAWPRHAPILFPIVGRLTDDTLRHEGKTYRLPQHGFARDRRFDWVESGAHSCTLRLTDDERTRALYPFAFRFEVAYAIGEGGLTMTLTVTNPADTVLPASFGGHPAFAWPNTQGVAKEAYTLTFERPEPKPLRGVPTGLLSPADRPSPVHGQTVQLTESFFAGGAWIFDAPESHWVRFAAPGAPALKVSWDGFPQLGIWMRPPGDFLCIEPWYGTASPAGFDGEFMDKPFIARIPPGQSVSASMTVAVEI